MIEPTELPELPRELRWRCACVEHGEVMIGWLAGPAFPACVHYDGAYKPCRFLMTKGALKCHRCTVAMREVWYVPLLTTPALDQVVTILSKTVGRVLKTMPLHTALKISKPKVGTSPTHLGKPDHGETSNTAYQRVLLRPAFDVRPYLLHLWQDRQLSEWCGLPFIASAATRAATIAGEQLAADQDVHDLRKGMFGPKPTE